MFLGYNYRIMLKRLALIVCSTALIVAVVLVARYDKLHNTEGKGYDIKCIQSSEPSATMNSLICAAEHGQKAESGQYSPAWWHVFFAFPEGITALLILLTLVAISLQTFYTRRAAVATEGAVTAANRAHALAENTAKQQLRAYICMDTAELRFVNSQLSAIVNFKNSGQTPAHEVQGWVGADITSHPLAKVLSKPLNAGLIYPKNTVGPGTGIQFMSRRIPLTEIDILAMFTPQTTFFAYGQLTYKDVFGDQWHTSFRLIAGGPEGVRVGQVTKEGVRKWALSPDMEGNDAT
jgi:hypothetical protein